MTRICTLTALLTSLLAIALPVNAVASGHVRTIVRCDPAAGQLPEGVAVDKPGHVFVSLAPLGQLLKVGPRSTRPEPFGSVPGVDPASDPGLLGLAVDSSRASCPAGRRW
jgi:hypothetical protein